MAAVEANVRGIQEGDFTVWMKRRYGERLKTNFPPIHVLLDRMFSRSSDFL